MSSKSTTTNVVPGAGAGEKEMQELLLQLMRQAGSQFDVGGIASGQGLVPSEADQRLVEESIGAASDIGRRELDEFLRGRQLQFDEVASARGIQGSSIEAVQRGQIEKEGVRQFADMLSRQTQQGSQALMQLPFQRTQAQLGANQQLLQAILGGGGTGLQAGLQERLAGTTTTTEQPLGPGDLLNLGGQLGSARLGR